MEIPYIKTYFILYYEYQWRKCKNLATRENTRTHEKTQ
jgi:hypothetical protein